MNKMSQYITTFSIIRRFWAKAPYALLSLRKKAIPTLCSLQECTHIACRIVVGLIIALLSSAFIYLNHYDFSYPFLNTILGIAALSLLLQKGKKVWFVSGFFIGLFWFWWIGLSFKHYNMPWAIPFVTLFISFTYGVLFWLIAYLAEKISSFVPQGAPEDITSPHPDRTQPLLLSLVIKSLGILGLSYIHPFGFDWFKPELVFVESYLGIEKWQFGIVLLSIVLSIWRKNLLFLGVFS